jgi:E3 ubiquitin-protein ligase Topors
LWRFLTKIQIEMEPEKVHFSAQRDKKWVKLQPKTITVQPKTTTVQPNNTTVQPKTITVESKTTILQPKTITVESNNTTVQPKTTTVESKTITVQHSCCPICLDTFKDKSFLLNCFHSFCFQCIKIWQKSSNFCPLCKAKMELLIYSIVDFQYKIYNLQSGKNQTSEDVQISQEALFIEQRRLIYSLEKRAKYSAVRSSSKLHSTNPIYLCKYPQKLKLMKPWLHLELNALLPNGPIELVKSHILTLIQRYDIQSDDARKCLFEYLGRDTELFVHEFLCFSRSSLDVSDYLKYAQY